MLGVLEGLTDAGGGGGGGEQTGGAADQTPQIDQAELEEQVNDLVEIRKKDILKRNLMNIVRENLELKQKVKELEARLQDQTSNDDSYNLLFRIDNDGDEEDTDNVDIRPADHGLILTDSQPQEEEEVVEKKKGGGNKCFNCLGDHMIADCPQPRNPREIQKNKREFQNKSMNAPRYHVDEKQRFGHFKPGLPSDKLRDALRLRSDQVPEYIYRMRDLGYPPGWLRSAEIQSSGIQLYRDRGEKAGNPGTEEDGELVEDSTQYDIEKLQAWPGFNAPFPSNLRDETHKYRARPLNRTKQLQEMIEELKPRQQQAYVRGKMQDTSVREEETKTSEKTNNDIIVLDETITIDSSMEEDESVVEEAMEPEPPTELAETETSNSGLSTSNSGVSTPARQTSTSSNNSVAKTEPGTPIVEMFSPFVKLPSQDGWGKDMSEHVAFENLPNYTGKWEQMSGLIKRIRKRGDVNTNSESEDCQMVPP